MNRASNAPTFLKKISGKRYKIIFGGILAITIVHFVMQISFIQSEIESLRSADLTAQTEDLKRTESAVEIKRPDAQIIDIKPEEYEVRKVKIITIPENAAPKMRRQAETVPLPTQVKKKAVRETRAARLRRAEKILTGV